jgi:hypothetical protein
MAWHSYHRAQIEEKQSQKRTLKLKIQPFVLTKNLAKELVLVAKSIFKFDDSRRKTLGG